LREVNSRESVGQEKKEREKQPAGREHPSTLTREFLPRGPKKKRKKKQQVKGEGKSSGESLSELGRFVTTVTLENVLPRTVTSRPEGKMVDRGPPR